MTKLSALPISESDLLRGVLDLARLTGWRTIHLRPAKTDKGWRTAVQGDGAGFPDVLALKGSRGIAWELKSKYTSPVTDAQCVWIDAFKAVGFDSGILYPSDWDYIEKELRRD